MRRPYLALVLLAAIAAWLILLSARGNAQSISVQLLNMSDTQFGDVLAVTNPFPFNILFDPARPPSDELRQLAAGDHAALYAATRTRLRSWSGYGTVDGPAPGQTVTFEVDMPALWGRSISLAASLPGGGFVGASKAYTTSTGVAIVDLLAWEAADTILVHRSRPSPLARAWLRYVKPPGPVYDLPYMTAAQRQERESCLADSPTCIWRLEDGRGYCSDCVPPLRPNAARTHCVR